MRAYLSYRYGDDITAIRNILSENDVEVFDSLSDIEYGSSLQQTIKNAVKSCDFIIFVYSDNNPHIAFEAGMAVALNKPIFSILAGGKEDTFLLDSTYIHAKSNEADKIKFGLELFLKNLVAKKNLHKSAIKLKPPIFYGGGEAIPTKNYFDVSARYNAIKDEPGYALEMFFQDVFQAYNVSIAKNSEFGINRKDWVPDFSIWSEELSPILGNPIIVEIKKELNNDNVSSLIHNLERLKSSSPIGSVLIFYDRLRGIGAKNLPFIPNRLFISIPDLVNQLQNNGFASAIRKFRNDIIHIH